MRVRMLVGDVLSGDIHPSELEEPYCGEVGI